MTMTKMTISAVEETTTKKQQKLEQQQQQQQQQQPQRKQQQLKHYKLICRRGAYDYTLYLINKGTHSEGVHCKRHAPIPAPYNFRIRVGDSLDFRSRFSQWLRLICSHLIFAPSMAHFSPDARSYTNCEHVFQSYWLSKVKIDYFMDLPYLLRKKLLGSHWLSKVKVDHFIDLSYLLRK